MSSINNININGLDYDIQPKVKHTTAERKTGEVWVNNKPIYSKIFVVTVNASSTHEIDISDLNYDNVWTDLSNTFCKYDGKYSNSSAIWCNRPETNDFGYIFVRSTKKLCIKNMSSNARDYYVTIKYTKETDEVEETT